MGLVLGKGAFLFLISTFTAFGLKRTQSGRGLVVICAHFLALELLGDVAMEGMGGFGCRVLTGVDGHGAVDHVWVYWTDSDISSVASKPSNGSNLLHLTSNFSVSRLKLTIIIRTLVLWIESKGI